MHQPTDDQLIKDTLAGNTRAYGTLVFRYQDFIYTIVLRMVKTSQEAEEVAQDAFIKAFESLETFRGDSKFSSWLYSIAYRKALDFLRKKRRMRTTEMIEDKMEHTFLDTENALKVLEAKERKEQVEACIQELPEEDAAIITFYYYEELSIKEISKIVNLTENNVKVKLYRGRKKLFTSLKQYVLPEITKSNGRAI